MFNETITADYINNNAEITMTNPYTDDNASLIWCEDENEFLLVRWVETWDGIEAEIESTGTDNQDKLEESLYRQGYIY